MGGRPEEPVRRLRRARHLNSASGRARLRIFRPLGIQDFAFLWAGACISLLGDGVYVVALAWQVYELSDAPTALSLVGVAWTLPLAIFLLFGGVLSDRMERRRILVAADVVRGLAVATIGILSVAGAIELWHLIALAAVFGTGEAFFGPAFTALVPQIVPRHLLVEANSLDQFLRPFAFNLAGPALGGLIVASLGAGEAFLLDAASFAVSAVAVLLMAPRPSVRSEQNDSSTFDDIREGFRFVRSRVWLWGTLVAAAIALLAYWGPFEVLIPYVIKNELGGGADSLGLVLASGGVGSIVAALSIGQFGVPRRHITFMYLAWSIGSFALIGFGLANATWQLMAFSFVEGAFFTSGLIVWGTLIQAQVPAALLGRVTSLDWFVSTSLVPVSFALTGPVAAWIGAKETLVAAGVLAGVATLLFLFLPGMRETERAGAPIV